MCDYMTDTDVTVNKFSAAKKNLLSLNSKLPWNSLLPLAEIPIWIIWILFEFVQYMFKPGQHGQGWSPVASQHGGSHPLQGLFCAVIECCPISAWVFSGYSSLLPQSKGMRLGDRWIDWFKIFLVFLCFLHGWMDGWMFKSPIHYFESTVPVSTQLSQVKATSLPWV